MPVTSHAGGAKLGWTSMIISAGLGGMPVALLWLWRAARFRASLDQVIAEVRDALSHPAKFLRVQSGRIHQAGGRYLFAQPSAGLGQADHDLPFIRCGALPADIAHPLELLEQWRQRVGFKEQLLAQAADGLVVLLPQRHDRDVLGVGEADLVQDRLVGPPEGEVGRIDGKAEKVAKSPSWLGFF